MAMSDGYVSAHVDNRLAGAEAADSSNGMRAASIRE